MADAQRKRVETKIGQGRGRRRFLGGYFVCGLALAAGLSCGPGKAAEPDVCELRDGNTRFICDVSAREAPADCRPDVIGDATRRRFLLQMTTVSLELLHLENQPGGRGPFAYMDSAGVLPAVRVELCRVRDGRCKCRMSYRRARLADLFYDAAACKRGSPFADDPLFFRARGCP